MINQENKINKVDFYVLPYQDKDKYWLFVCNLIEKIYTSELCAVVLIDDYDLLIALDKKLWTYKQQSFIPHEIANGANSEPFPNILIAQSMVDVVDTDFKFQVVVDLSEKFSKLNAERIVIVTDQSPDLLQFSREKYKYYSKLGLAVDTHKL